MFNQNQILEKIYRPFHNDNILISSDELEGHEEAFYVPLLGTSSKNESSGSDLFAKVKSFIHSSHKVLLIQGGAGSGKSMFCQHLARELSAQCLQQNERNYLPIYISLPRLSDPKTSLISEGLETYQLTEKDLQIANENYSIVFILDSYDEMNSLINLYVTNKLNLWQNIKIIVTCRSTYLSQNYSGLFAPYDNENKGTLQELYILPFGDPQVKTYIHNYVELQKPSLNKKVEYDVLKEEWLRPETYEYHIKKIPNLSRLITTPFLLRITMSVLPDIIKKFNEKEQSLTQEMMRSVHLYDAFIEQWFNRQEHKLIANHEPIDFFLQKDFTWFAQEIAKKMRDLNTNQIKYTPHSSLAANAPASPWAYFFNDENPKIVRARKGCPLMKTGVNQYEFIHETLRDYFIAKDRLEQVLNSYPEEVITEDNIIEEDDVFSSFNRYQEMEKALLASYIKDPVTKIGWWHVEQVAKIEFNLKQLQATPLILQFFEEKWLDRQSMLLELIETSQDYAQIIFAAANAATVLNRQKFEFRQLNWSNIKLAGADLSNARFFQVNLENADLRGACLDNATFQDANVPMLPNLNEDLNLLLLSEQEALSTIRPKKWLSCMPRYRFQIGEVSSEQAQLTWFREGDQQHGLLLETLNNQHQLTIYLGRCVDSRFQWYPVQAQQVSSFLAKTSYSQRPISKELVNMCLSWRERLIFEVHWPLILWQELNLPLPHEVKQGVKWQFYSTVTSLNRPWSYLQQSPSASLAQEIISQLGDHTSEDLDLSHKQLKDEDMEVIVSHLSSYPTLRILRLSYNCITKEGLRFILTKAPRNSGLQQVLLDNNWIIFDNIFAKNTLAPNMQTLPWLNLDLSMNFIQRGGVTWEKSIDSGRGGKKIPVVSSKEKLERDFKEARLYCKTLFHQHERLNGAVAASIRSYLVPEENITSDCGVVALLAYKGANNVLKKLWGANEHAFLAIEGISQWGQRYLISADLYTTNGKNICIQIEYITPADFNYRTNNLERIHKKHALKPKKVLKSLVEHLLKFRDSQALYRYAVRPNPRKKEFNCLTWAEEMLLKAEVVEPGSEEISSWVRFPSNEVGNEKCFIM